MGERAVNHRFARRKELRRRSRGGGILPWADRELKNESSR